jgi:quinol-cytochrome oxidoreductase complex cytochrome b subunit
MMEQFIKHIFPRYILKNNLKITYTFCFGGLALTSFLILIFSGVLLIFYYIPTIEGAYDSILMIEKDVFLGRYIRSIHYISGIFFFISLFLHTLRVIFTSAFTRGYNFIVGLLILFLSLFEGYTGYILPMDQISYWAGVTGMELIKTVHLGDEVVSILFPDRLTGNLSLIRVYILHIIIMPGLIVILTSIHFYKIRKDKGILPYL